MPPRAVLVHRRSEYTALIERHGTRGQGEFFLRSRGRDIDELEAQHRIVAAAVTTVTAAVPEPWRRAKVERAELPRFVFEPGDVVVVVGQDGLVANVAKYLDGQPVVGINPEPERNPGVLVRHSPEAARDLLRVAAGPIPRADQLRMVQAETDDGQRLLALNEVYVGHASHQTARYILAAPGRQRETQASSGVIVGTGTGATGWCRSAWLERSSQLRLPQPVEARLAWFVREAWPSPATGTACTEGELLADQSLSIGVISDQLVLFGDGIESDAVGLSAGQVVVVGLASQTLCLVS